MPGLTMRAELSRLLAEDRALATGEPIDTQIDYPFCERGPCPPLVPRRTTVRVDRDTLIVRLDLDRTGNTTTLVITGQRIPLDLLDLPRCFAVTGTATAQLVGAGTTHAASPARSTRRASTRRATPDEPSTPTSRHVPVTRSPEPQPQSQETINEDPTRRPTRRKPSPRKRKPPPPPPTPDPRGESEV